MGQSVSHVDNPDLPIFNLSTVNQTCQYFEEVIDQALLDYHNKIRKLLKNAKNQEELTFNNFVNPLALIESEYQNIINPILFLKDVSPHYKIRSLARKTKTYKIFESQISKCLKIIVPPQKTQEKIILKLYLSKYNVNQNSHQDYLIPNANNISNTYNNNISNTYKNNISNTNANNISNTNNNNITKKSRKELIRQKELDRQIKKIKELEKEENQLTLDFEKNISEDNSFLILNNRDLIGCPIDFLENTKIKNSEQHKIKASKHNWNTIINNCKNIETIKLVNQFMELRSDENLRVIQKLHHIRSQIAMIKGFRNCADYELRNQSFGSGRTTLNFLNSLLKKIILSNEININRLDQKINQQDQKQFMDYVKQSKEFKNKIRNYFPVKTSVFNILQVLGEIFKINIKLIRLSTEYYWNSNIDVYQVIDYDQSTLGYFYIDLYQKKYKTRGFATFNIIQGFQNQHQEQTLPVTALVGNFSEDFWSHSEVETFFHEMGHVLHNIFGGYRSKYSLTSGTNVDFDFVEVPSQFVEQLAWNPKIIRKISNHYQTGLPIDDQDINRIIKSRQSTIFDTWIHTINLAIFDQEIHNIDFLTQESLINSYQENINKFQRQTSNPKFDLSRWHHLIDYNCKYYTYVWSMVVAMDLYSKFDLEQDGIKFRELILEPGGSQEASKLIYNFLGREANNQAFLSLFLAKKMNQ